VLLGISEAGLVVLAFLAAMLARLGPDDASIQLSYEQGFFKIGVIAAAFIFCMYYFDLYDSTILNNRREVLIRVVQVSGTVCIFLAVLYFAYPPLQLGRGIFLIGFLLVSLMLLSWRHLFLKVNALPRFSERVLILGEGELAESLICELDSRRELGVRVVGHMRQLGGTHGNPGVSAQEQLRDILCDVRSYKPHRIIVAMRDRRGKLPLEALLKLKSSGVGIQDGAEVYEAVTGKIPIQSLRLSWLLFSPGFQVAKPMLVYKRLCSIVFSALGILLALPLMVLIGLAIRIDSDGPVIFRQKRIGKDGQIFTLYKFRSMTVSSNDGGPHRPAGRTDDRFTRIGRILRRTRLDELPQLFNIFRGDMHFVGPRPFVPDQENECLQKIDYYRQRWTVKPGATGWAQVNRGYNVTMEDNAEKLAYDLFYIKNISVGLDLLILFKTAKILLLGRGSQ